MDKKIGPILRSVGESSMACDLLMYNVMDRRYRSSGIVIVTVLALMAASSAWAQPAADRRPGVLA
ncbi:MAG: hypothetical protein AAGC55_18125, partial [Myxococcota bacterium]